VLLFFFAFRTAIILFLYLYMYFYRLAVNKSCLTAINLRCILHVAPLGQPVCVYRSSCFVVAEIGSFISFGHWCLFC